MDIPPTNVVIDFQNFPLLAPLLGSPPPPVCFWRYGEGEKGKEPPVFCMAPKEHSRFRRNPPFPGEREYFFCRLVARLGITSPPPRFIELMRITNQSRRAPLRIRLFLSSSQVKLFKYGRYVHQAGASSWRLKSFSSPLRYFSPYFFFTGEVSLIPEDKKTFLYSSCL